METVFAAVLAASLVGSLHCAGMCGPLLAFVVGGGPAGGTVGPGAGALRLQAAYHLARGAGYVTLGLVVGFVGHLVDVAGVLAGLTPLAAGLAGLTLILTGLAIIARRFGARLPKAHLPSAAQGALRRAQGRALRLPPLTRALAIGATTTLLPCGWLYAFAVTAAGTGHPVSGALVMLAFWLGTVPVLGALGVGVQRLTGAFGPTLQVAASLALVALGAWTLFGRSQLDAEALVQRATRSANEAAQSVPSIDATPACCSESSSSVGGPKDAEAAR